MVLGAGQRCRSIFPGHFSQRHSLFEDAISESESQALLADHVDLAPEELLQLEPQGCMVQQAPPRFHRDKQIKIALFVGLASGYRPEDPDIPRAVSSSNPKNFFPFFF